MSVKFYWVFTVVIALLLVGEPSIFDSVRVLLARTAGLAH